MQWNPQRYLSQHGFIIERGQALVDLLAPQAGERILDLGCGTGDITRSIAARGATAIGVDVSPDMVACARARFPGLDFRRMDAADMPFDREFDAIFSHAALHWVSRAEEAIQGMWRALKPGGRVVAEFGAGRNVQGLQAAFSGALRAVAGVEYRSPWYFPRLGEYSAQLEAGGFVVRAAWYFALDTRLAGKAGLRNWLELFLPGPLAVLDDTARAALLAATEANARARLWRDGAWHADYRRLRVIAEKPAAGGG